MTAGLYMLGQLRIFYSTACPRTADKSKYAANSSLSSCVLSRLNQCNALFNGTSFTEWKPVSTSFILSVVDATLSQYVPLSIQRVFSVPFAIARALVSPSSLASDSNTGVANDFSKSIALRSLLIRRMISHLFSEWLSIHRSYIARSHRCRARRTINCNNNPADIDRPINGLNK